MLTLISATPSPYARKNRIAMIEKGIPFELQSEIPWHSDTETPKYNPLEKLPILIFDDGKPPIYESWFIQEYIVCKYKGTGPGLSKSSNSDSYLEHWERILGFKEMLTREWVVPKGEDDVLKARQIQVLADGACDAMGLAFFETSRGELKSTEWEARQLRKVYGVLKACDELVQESSGGFLVNREFSVADIAVGVMVGMMNMIESKFGLIQWSDKYPQLKKYWEVLEERKSFKETQPIMFEITEKVA